MTILDAAISELLSDLDAGTIVPQQLVDASLERIHKQQPDLNMYITVADPSELKTTVAASSHTPSEQLLCGIPVAVKDNIMTKAMKMTCASKILENFDHPLYDATVIRKLKEAGSIIMGKTNLDEFAMGASNETSYFGAVANPYNTEYVSGGSSGGSAVAVATGTVKIALGTDTGGSVRQPAGFTNTVGLKPTYGRVSRFGVTAFASSLDQVGIITQTVADNARALSVIAGHDEYDTTSSKLPVPLYHEQLEASLKGKKIAVFEEYISENIDPEVIAITKAAIAVYEKLGAQVEVVSLPHLKYVVPAYYIIAPCEASSNLARFDGLHYGYRSPEATNLEEVYTKTRAEGFGDEVKRRIVLGTYFLNHDTYDAYYIQAAKLRTLIHQDFQHIFETYDMILGPTTPTPAFKIGEQIDHPVQMYLNDLCTIPANLIGLPAISIPGGFNSQGLPVGIQLTAKAFDEQSLFQFAYAFESETEYYKQTPQCEVKENDE